jgi:hypothetical protein
MSRLLSVLLLITAAQLTAPVADVRAEAELSVWPPDTFVSAGNTFELQILANGDIADLMGFNATVWYDSLVLRIESVTEGSLLRDSGYATVFRWLNQGEETNVIETNGAVLGHTVDGPGVLCTLTFRARVLGVSGIHIIASDLRDGVNGSISHTVVPGMVYVDWVIPVQPVTWGAIKNVYR